MMSEESPEVRQFKVRLKEALQRDPLQALTRTIAKHGHVYTCGDHDGMVYIISSGQIKLLAIAPDGKQCLLAMHTQGDIFGELCLADGGGRRETAIAMAPTVVKQLPPMRFLHCLSQNGLLEGFVRYMAVRIAEQQQVIANLATVDSERRLAKILLQLAYKLGQPDARSIRINHWISHEELSEMVGTTRPRVSEFMKRFRDLGLIELTTERHLIVKEEQLTRYLWQSSQARSWHRRSEP